MANPHAVTLDDLHKMVLEIREHLDWGDDPPPAKAPGPDPWAHRNIGMRCSTCMWYVAKEPPDDLVGRQLGRCRRRAPTMNGYPAVFPTDWCGDHKVDETKL